MGTDSFLIHANSEDIYADLAKDVKKRFNTSIYEGERPLLIGKNKKKIGLMTGELNGKIRKEFVVLRPKMYSYLTDDDCVDNKVKGTKKCVIK